MGLVEKYKASLAKQGIKVNLQPYRPKKDRTRLFAIIFAIVIAVPSYFFVYQNYNACTISANAISSAEGAGNPSTINGSLVLNCDTDTGLYTITIALIIAIISLLGLKAIRYRYKNGRLKP